jgi:hypothetical protein
MWPTSLLYPYGSSEGDANGTFSGCEDGYLSLTVQPGFQFFGHGYTSLYVSNSSDVIPIICATIQTAT